MTLVNMKQCLLLASLFIGGQACSVQTLPATDTQSLLTGFSVFGEDVQVAETSLNEILARLCRQQV